MDIYRYIDIYVYIIYIYIYIYIYVNIIYNIFAVLLLAAFKLALSHRLVLSDV